MGLRSLSESLHELETKIKNSGNEASSTLLQSEQIKRIRENLAEYRSYALVLRQSQSSQSANACSLLSTAIEPFVAIWIQQMDEVGLPIEEVRILDSFLRWTPQSIHLIRDLCLHAVNNSLDHGFVFPFRKGEKVDRPTLEIAAKQQNHELKLEIRDNGVGLNMEKLREMALAKGFSLSAQESISDVLFMDGVSTAQEVTLTSGRGMGLSAIQSVVRRNGGSVKIANREGSRGTVVSISLPLQDQRYILEAI